MEIPEAWEFIWLFESDPKDADDLPYWPHGEYVWRLRRGDRTVVFHIEPNFARADIALFAADEEVLTLNGLGPLSEIRVDRAKDGRERPILFFDALECAPLTLRTKPDLHLSWRANDFFG